MQDCDIGPLFSFYPRSAGHVDAFLSYGTVLEIEKAPECRPVDSCHQGLLVWFRSDILFDHVFDHGGVPSEIPLELPPLFIGLQERQVELCEQVLVAVVREEAFSSWVCGTLVSCDQRPRETWRATRIFVETRSYPSRAIK